MVLQAIPGISAKLKQIIQDVASGTSAILQSGAVTHPTASTILAAWTGVLAALQNDPALPATSLAPIQQLAKAVQSALLQDELAAQSVDWATIRTMGLVPVPLPPQLVVPPAIAPVPPVAAKN